MCNLYSITTNQAAIIALFRVINRDVGNLPMSGVFPDYPTLVVRNAGCPQRRRRARDGDDAMGDRRPIEDGCRRRQHHLLPQGEKDKAPAYGTTRDYPPAQTSST
jgi:hypothetical protein